MLTPAPDLWVSAWSTSAQRWVHPSAPALLPEGRPWASQCCGCVLSYHQGKLHSLIGSCLVSGIPASSQPNSCSWAFLLSMPDGSWVTSYHCWVVTTWISPSLLEDPHREANELWAGWVDSEMGWKLIEQTSTEAHDQWHKVQLETSR